MAMRVFSLYEQTPAGKSRRTVASFSLDYEGKCWKLTFQKYQDNSVSALITGFAVKN